MTPIDSFYEYLGFSFGQGVDSVLRSLAVPLIVGLSGCVWACVRTAERGEPKALAAHLLYLMLMVWLLAPVSVPFGNPYHRAAARGTVEAGQDVELRPPRALYHANEAVDLAIRRATSRVNDRFALAPYEWERIARMVHTARIQDPILLNDYREFLGACYTRLIGRLEAHERTPAPLDEAAATGYLPSDVLAREEGEIPCGSAVSALRKRLLQHLRGDAYHREVVSAARAWDGGEGFEEEYLRTVSLREWLSPDLSEGEDALLRRSLGARPLRPDADGGILPFPDTRVLEWDQYEGVGALAALAQSWDQAFEAHQRYYLVVLYAPHLYGWVLVMLLGLFPIVGAWALAPRGWKALVNFGKVYLSVKLWPLVWAAISLAGAARKSIDATMAGTVDMRHVWLAGLSMYLVTPALCFLVVQLATTAAQAAVSHALPAPAGAPSPMAAVNLGRSVGRR